MSFLRIVRQPALRPLSRTTPRLAFTNSRRNASDYGSPEGDQVKESPKDRGPNPSEHLEHPGPPPPSTAGKSEQTTDKGGKDTSSSSDSGSGSSNGGSSKSGTQAAQPKILNESPPQGDQAPEEVQKHNREMDARNAQSTEKRQDKDKVGKEFWSGHGGADRQP
ncbi:hypothetical protein LTR62_008393 [Meristemomyces frigidus]|uniref:Uncharacterized protein n=1 Tax=Meristemomyces frigidus TaxID=1508187 RepID=A0AAN7TAW4_9PEZI|nr:hypothetical protein LTR62_008393 [Meristemomyces frigidus]